MHSPHSFLVFGKHKQLRQLVNSAQPGTASRTQLAAFAVPSGQFTRSLCSVASSLQTAVAVAAVFEVVGSSSDEAARIWCANTGKCLHTLQGHAGTGAKKL